MPAEYQQRRLALGIQLPEPQSHEVGSLEPTGVTSAVHGQNHCVPEACLSTHIYHLIRPIPALFFPLLSSYQSSSIANVSATEHRARKSTSRSLHHICYHGAKHEHPQHPPSAQHREIPTRKRPKGAGAFEAISIDRASRYSVRHQDPSFLARRQRSVCPRPILSQRKKPNNCRRWVSPRYSNPGRVV